MSRPFPPHFLGWFGVTCPIVIAVLEAMKRPKAIRRMPPQYQDGLQASLACDLAERLKFGVALGLVLDPTFESPLFDEIWGTGSFRVWVAETEYLEREGCSVNEPTQPIVSHLCPANAHPAPRWQPGEAWMEKYAEGLPANFLELVTPETLEKTFFWKRGGASQPAGRIDPQSVVSGRNFLLDQGPPYYLRNTDPVWWADFTGRVMNRLANEAIARWCSVRDRANNLLLSDRTGDLRKWDYHAASLFLECIAGSNRTAEVYGLQTEDAEPRKINGARETCRHQDDHVLCWFEKMGLRVNPYARWLHRLVEVRSQSTAFVDWEGVKAKADRFVPDNVLESDDLRQAQLCWCLSRLNPDQYPYRPRFSSAIDQEKGEQLLRSWWDQVRADQFRQYR